MIKDYNRTINYHPGEAYVVADTLSRKKKKSQCDVLSKELIKKMEKLGLKIKNLEHKEGRIYEMLLQLEILNKRIKN